MRGELWLVIGVGILILSLVLDQVPLVIISLLFILTGAISRLWNRYCLNRIVYKRSLSQTKVFFGDEIFYQVEVANRKLLPLPWIQIEDELPEQVTLLKGKTTNVLEDRTVLTNMFPISWYHRVTRRFPMRCEQRGCFVFGPTRIRSGDLFGFFRKETMISKLDYLFVYPRLVPLDKLGIPSKQLFGDIRVQQHLFQDPVLTAGVRDYRAGDSLKRIHWKSSARLGKLQTRIYEPTTTIDISLFLDVRTTESPYWGSVAQLQELGIIAAASISQYALEAGFRIGLYLNQITRFSEGLARVPHSQHPEQLTRILETLSQIHQVEARPAPRFIRQEARNLPWGSSMVVISAQANEELVNTLLDMKRRGHSVSLIKVGGSVDNIHAPKLPVYHITDETAWDVVKEINLVEK
ncbi:MAG: DUF58 domain-containing protein [Dehalococcoidia bacterium]|jgi:uncharacterized protein (DUF58 family)